MLRSYWGYIATAVGCLVAAALLWAMLQPRQPDIPAHQGLQAQSPSYRAGGAQCDPKRLTALAGRAAANERGRCEEAAEQHRLQSNDLVQQTRSANAAEELTDLTFSQSRMMLTGVIIGLFTLVAAIAAALFAKRAAEEAGRGADAAETSVARAMEISHAQLRAHLASDKEIVTREEGTNKFEAEIVLKNTGSTPAYDLTIAVDCYFRYFNGGITPIDEMFFRNGTTATGTPCSLTFPIVLEADEMRALEADKGVATMKLRGSFADEFAVSWVYELDLQMPKQSLKTGLLYTSDSSHTRVENEKREQDATHEPKLL